MVAEATTLLRLNGGVSLEDQAPWVGGREQR